jgi:hypothetical protein
MPPRGLADGVVAALADGLTEALRGACAIGAAAAVAAVVAGRPESGVLCAGRLAED